MDRELRGETLQTAEKMTSLTHTVNIIGAEIDSTHADPVQVHSAWTQLIISLLHRVVKWEDQVVQSVFVNAGRQESPG